MHVNKLPLILFAALISTAAIAQKSTIAFRIPEKDLIPEGIAYDPGEKAFYLGSINKRKIVKITANGQSTDFTKSGQDDLLQVLGMRVDSNGYLWACNNTPEEDTIKKIANIHVYDTRNGKLVTKYTVSDGKKHLFNDIHFTPSGDAYVSDSDGGAIFRVRKGSNTIEEFIEAGKIRYPNGLTGNDDRAIFVSTGSGLGIVRIDLATKEVVQVPHATYFIIGLDGLYFYNNSLIGVQNVTFPDGIVKYTLDPEMKKFDKIELLATDDGRWNTPTTGVVAGNDFYFIANSQLFQLVRNHGRIKDPAKLTDTYIMKIPLN